MKVTGVILQLPVVISLILYIECMPGYTGPNCETRCPYPTYGNRCQGYCNCSTDMCAESTGCRSLTTGIIWF